MKRFVFFLLFSFVFTSCYEVFDDAGQFRDKFVDENDENLIDESYINNERRERLETMLYNSNMDWNIDIPPIPKKDSHKNKQCKIKPEYQYTELDLKLTVEKLKSMVNFFLKHINKIIADGLYGMRMAQGCLKHVVLNLHKTHPNYSTIHNMYKILTESIDIVYEKIKKRNTEYDRKFLPVLSKPERFQRKWKNVNSSLVWPVRAVEGSEIFSESISDNCIGNMLGTNAHSTRKCVVTKDCLKVETRKYTKSYFLTHQVLYFIAGEDNGCRESLIKVFGSERSLNHFYDVAGANINAEMLEAEKHDSFTDIQALDIYAEQGAICSMLGMVECTQRHKLHNVMTHIDANGCIRIERPHHHRQKRSNVNLDGCSEHTGAVVMGFLASHLRFMLLKPPCHMMQ